MSNRGYDVVVDVDAEGEDLGRTDLADDNLEFHNSDFTQPKSQRGTLPADSNASFLPTSAGGPNRGSSSSNPNSKAYLWSISFYAQFFDVDTAEVLRRCLASLFPRANFLDVLDGNPDLYGPFWIATTVVVILFLSGTISGYLAEKANGDHYVYDFDKLGGAAGLVYGYTFVVPIGLWGLLRWFGSEGANVLECWALYGYANLIWIPVALVSWSGISALNFAFVGTGFALSAVFLFRNLYPVLSATDAKTSRVLLIAVVALHAGLAIAINFLFFAHKSRPNKDAGGGAKKPDDDDDHDDKIRLLRMFVGL